MPSTDVAKRYDHTLKVDCLSWGLNFSIEYDSGFTFPWSGQSVSWAEWERIVAWIELQRKEAALRESKQKKS